MSEKRKLSPTFDMTKSLSKFEEISPVEVMDSRESPEHISEYKEAIERFGEVKNNKNLLEDDHIHMLDTFVEKLCREEASVDVGADCSLFYEIVYYSDFIQIKDTFIGSFYSNLCNSFVLSSLIDDIIRNIRKLDDIPHVKSYIARGLINLLRISSTIESNSLVLEYSREKLLNHVDLKGVTSITIRPSAYKVMFSNEWFNVKHLNFLFKLFDVKELILRGCNLNGRDMKDLFKELKLQSLNLSECGMSVNEIIVTNVLNDLETLDVSENPLFDKTLKEIRCIPLKNLNIYGCIKTSGKFINSIWFHEYFRMSYNTEEIKTEAAAVNVDLLWEDGILRETIQVLNVGHNILTHSNFKKILKLPLKELDITESLELVKFSELVFPSSLKVLKARKNEFQYNTFKILCELELERLEMDYSESFSEDFTELINSPITHSLQELFLGISFHWKQIIKFISRIKLKTFHFGPVDVCGNVDLEMDIEMPIKNFISYYPEERKHLQVLKIEGRIEGTFSTEFKNLNNLRELSLIVNAPSEEINRILSCENLHESILELEVNGKYTVKDQDLIQIAKFNKLENLSFCFSHNVSPKNMRQIVEMKMLKKLELTVIIEEALDENMARLLCIAPIKHLKFVSNGKITPEAYEILLKNDNFSNFSKHIVSLHIERSIFEPSLLKLLQNVHLKSIKFNECCIESSIFFSFLDNENLVYTLEYLYLYFLNQYEYQVPRSLSNLNLSKLDMFNPVSIDTIDVLTTEPISKFLLCLTMNTRCEKSSNYIRYLLKTSLSKVYPI